MNKVNDFVYHYAINPRKIKKPKTSIPMSKVFITKSKQKIKLPKTLNEQLKEIEVKKINS